MGTRLCLACLLGTVLEMLKQEWNEDGKKVEGNDVADEEQR